MRRDGSLAAALLRLTEDVETGEPGMNDDDQSESDGLDALASALPATESEEADEELDLASLAAVAGARATQPGTEAAPLDAGEKLVLAPLKPSPDVPLPLPLPARSRTWLIPALAAFAIAIGVMGYILGRSSRPEDQSAGPPAASPPTEPAAPAAAPAAPAVAPPVAIAPARLPPAVEPPSAAAPSTTSPSAAPAQPIGRTPRTSNPPTVAAVPSPSAEPSRAPSAAEDPAPAKPAEAATTLAKTEPAPSRSVDALLDEALSGSGARPAASAASAGELPEAPSRDEVTQAMAVLLPAIRGCAMGQTGLATAGIVVRGDGRVASVELSGAPFEGTASGRCMEGVLRRARFSRFRQPTFRVRFPFSIQ
jgi:hypothetical protein